MQGLSMEKSYWWSLKIILTYLRSNVQPVSHFTKKKNKPKAPQNPNMMVW